MDSARESPAGSQVDSIPDYYREIVHPYEDDISFGSVFGGLFPMEIHNFISPLPVVLFVTGDDWEFYHGDGGKYIPLRSTENGCQQPLLCSDVIEHRELFTSTHALYDSIVRGATEWLRPAALKARPNGCAMPYRGAGLLGFSFVPETNENASRTTQQQQRLQRESERRREQLDLEELLADSDYESDSDTGLDSDIPDMEVFVPPEYLLDDSDEDSDSDLDISDLGDDDIEITLANDDWGLQDWDDGDSDDDWDAEFRSQLIRRPPRSMLPRCQAERQAVLLELVAFSQRVAEDENIEFRAEFPRLACLRRQVPLFRSTKTFQRVRRCTIMKKRRSKVNALQLKA
ncbi:hypothetical protein F5Y18DRAFT_433943 [Xylariaceae sp. FL1019]|nr:hypothetical protein F5Y18DRAFT_433943 [Xylariaceae sp. FL1019]